MKRSCPHGKIPGNTDQTISAAGAPTSRSQSGLTRCRLLTYYRSKYPSFGGSGRAARVIDWSYLRVLPSRFSGSP